MHKIFIASLIFFSSVTWAQAEGGPGGAGADATGANTQYEASFNIGNLLPNQIPGITEITGLGGIRAGYRLSPIVVSEAGLTMGNGHGAQYKDIYISARIDVPVENLVGHLYIGPDFIMYKGAAKGNVKEKDKMQIGGHLGGGIMAQIGGSLWVRTDMKFNVKPGTSMYLSIGFMWRFGTAGGGGGGAE